MKVLLAIFLALLLAFDPIEPAKAQPEIAIGDSIALGLKDAGRLNGGAVVGASPLAVMHMVLSYPYPKDAIVILSCGASNNPAQLPLCRYDLRYLTDHGAKVILLGVGDVIPGSAAINVQLERYAAEFPYVFFIHGWPGVHPPSYSHLLRFIQDHECIFLKVCAT